MPQVEPGDSQRPARRFERVAALLALMVIVAFIISPPRAILDKADLFGYATCHRIPARSLHLAGHQLPLCARCTGTYLGVLTGLGAFGLRRRWRAAGFPPLRVLGALVGFWAIWGVDGLNSYLALIGSPHLYEPHHLLRMLTGCLNGLALGALVWPVFSFSLWKQTSSQRVVNSLRELGILVAVAWIAGLIVYTEPPFLLYPVALLSALGVLLMLTLVNTILALVLLRQESAALTWRDARLPLILGLALALIEISLIDFVRLNFLPPLSF